MSQAAASMHHGPWHQHVPTPPVTRYSHSYLHLIYTTTSPHTRSAISVMAGSLSHAAAPSTMLVPFEASRDPMSLSAHDYLIQPQFTRHLFTVSQPADLQGGNHASDPAARERPVPMMLMYRDDLCRSSLKTNEDGQNLVSSNSYHVKASDKDLEEAEIESMIHDIETGPSSPIPPDSNSRVWSSPSLPIDEAEFWGHEQASMSATSVEEQTAYVPLTASRKPAAQRKDLGEGLDWNKILMRSRSENNLVFLKSRDRSIFCEKVLMLGADREDVERWRQEGNIAELDLLWPPKAKILVGG